MIIHIVGGSGIMGQIHKKEFEKRGHTVIITGRNSQPSATESAKNSDITIISVPIENTKELIKEVAPHCKAIIDFTGLKEMPINAMEEFSSQDCEIGGLHPLYGAVDSIKGRTVIYTPHKRSGEKINQLLEIFQEAGAVIKKMTPKRHDAIVGGISQNLRLSLLENYAKIIKEHDISAQELFDISPPPTQILLCLLARQADSSNDNLYSQMKKYNEQTKILEKEFQEILKKDVSNEEIRKIFGEKLHFFQEKAKKLIENI